MAMSANMFGTEFPRSPVAGSMKEFSEEPMQNEPRFDELRQSHAGEVRGEAVGHAAGDRIGRRAAPDRDGSQGHRDAALGAANDLVAMRLGEVERERRDDVSEVGLLGESAPCFLESPQPSQ